MRFRSLVLLVAGPLALSACQDEAPLEENVDEAGRAAKGGDNPPRPECAPQWHPKVLPFLPDLKLTLLVGRYAQNHYLGSGAKRTVTETVKAWREYLPRFLPTPHPSWRATHWLRKNPWFDAEVVPEMQKRVRRLV